MSTAPKTGRVGFVIEYHRKQVRDVYGFRTITVGNEDKAPDTAFR
ncbi:hypothetical protein OG979_38920 [Actinomadura citrea]|nr:hypothetical protein [Actinomadura citrea]